MEPTGERVNPRHLAKILSVDLDAAESTAGVKSKTNANTNGQAHTGEAKPVNLSAYRPDAGADEVGGEHPRRLRRCRAACSRMNACADSAVSS